MDPEGIMPTKISQTEKHKYHMITYMWHVKKQNKQTNKTKLIDTENISVVAREGGWGGQKGPNFSYKISHGNTVDSKVTAVNSTCAHMPA